MTDTSISSPPDYDAERAAEEKAADASYEAALSAKPDKSTDRQNPNYDAGLDTYRRALREKTSEDPEDEIA